MLAYLSDDTPALRPFFIADFKLLPQHYQNLIADVNFCNTWNIKKAGFRESPTHRRDSRIRRAAGLTVPKIPTFQPV